MTKYDPLGKYLRAQSHDHVPMTFAEIERITGTKLPASQRYPAWWSNNPANNVMTRVWLDAGFRSEQVDVVGKKLVFRRVSKPRETELADAKLTFRHESGAEERRRHPAFGALKGTFTLEAGFDPTLPAMPDWAVMMEEEETAG